MKRRPVESFPVIFPSLSLFLLLLSRSRKEETSEIYRSSRDLPFHNKFDILIPCAQKLALTSTWKNGEVKIYGRRGTIIRPPCQLRLLLPLKLTGLGSLPSWKRETNIRPGFLLMSSFCPGYFFPPCEGQKRFDDSSKCPKTFTLYCINLKWDLFLFFRVCIGFKGLGCQLNNKSWLVC